MSYYSDTIIALDILKYQDYYLLDLVDNIYNDDSKAIQDYINRISRHMANAGTIVFNGENRLKIALKICLIDHYICRGSIIKQISNLETMLGSVPDYYIDRLFKISLNYILDAPLVVSKPNLGLSLKDLNISWNSNSLCEKIPMKSVRLFNGLIINNLDDKFILNLTKYGFSDLLYTTELLLYDDSIHLMYNTDSLRVGIIELKRNEKFGLSISEAKDIKEKGLGLIRIVTS